MEDNDKPKYLRWHPATPDTGTFRGDDLSGLNAVTMDLIHEHAIAEDCVEAMAESAHNAW